MGACFEISSFAFFIFGPKSWALAKPPNSKSAIRQIAGQSRFMNFRYRCERDSATQAATWPHGAQEVNSVRVGAELQQQNLKIRVWRQRLLPFRACPRALATIPSLRRDNARSA